MKRVLALTRYGPLGASSRVRFYQFAPALRDAGLDVTECALLPDDYVERLYRGSGSGKAFLLAAYVRRIRDVFATRRFDLVWIEKELLPFVPAWIEAGVLAGVPTVVDYDDATFHTYDRHKHWPVRTLLGRKVDAVMRRARIVVAGNPYLAARAEAAGARRVEVLPSVIDMARYGAVEPEPNGPFTVGWLGSPGSEKLLEAIREPLERFSAQPGVRLVLVGASPAALRGVLHETWPWSEEGEVNAMRAFHVGIMPLSDTPWERGKCGFKLVQYMGVGRPVVASPVGVNVDIVVDGVSGFLAATPGEWTERLDRLRADAELRQRLGAEGRQRAKSTYSLETAAPRLAALLHAAAK